MLWHLAAEIHPIKCNNWLRSVYSHRIFGMQEKERSLKRIEDFEEISEIAEGILQFLSEDD